MMNKSKTEKQCLWCLKHEPELSFSKKANTIPKSLGDKILIGIFVMTVTITLVTGKPIMENTQLKLH